jgi:hypothetical protein
LPQSCVSSCCAPGSRLLMPGVDLVAPSALFCG